MMLRLRAFDTDSVFLSVDAIPGQAQVFGGTTQTTEATESEDKPPFHVGDVASTLAAASSETKWNRSGFACTVDFSSAQQTGSIR